MSEPIVFIDSSQVLEGSLEEVKVAMKELVEFVEANEPRTIAYNVYLDEGRGLMTVVQIHPDSASMEFHMEAAAALFRRFARLLKMQAMDVYGRPSDGLLAQMRQKAEMLGLASVHVHDFHAGLARFAELTRDI